MTVNLLRAELARMDPTARAALHQVATARIQADPDLTEPISAVLWALALEIHRIEQETTE